MRTKEHTAAQHFMEACFRDNTLKELLDSLAGEVDDIECKEWGISHTEWREALADAVTWKYEDLSTTAIEGIDGLRTKLFVKAACSYE